MMYAQRMAGIVSLFVVLLFASSSVAKADMASAMMARMSEMAAKSAAHYQQDNDKQRCLANNDTVQFYNSRSTAGLTPYNLAMFNNYLDSADSTNLSIADRLANVNGRIGTDFVGGDTLDVFAGVDFAAGAYAQSESESNDAKADYNDAVTAMNALEDDYTFVMECLEQAYYYLQNP